jgi:hypothetical protein
LDYFSINVRKTLVYIVKIAVRMVGEAKPIVMNVITVVGVLIQMVMEDVF